MLSSQDLASLKVIRLGSPLSRAAIEDLAERLRGAFMGLLHELSVIDAPPPPVRRIEAALLTQVLDQQWGGHVLGLTDIDLVDPSGQDFFQYMFGGKDERNHVAVVSSRRLVSRDPDRFLGRLLKVSLHEIGHNFGLVHHYSFEPATDGGYCPMTKGDFNRHGERSYVRSVIDARGFRFCERCRNFLRRAWRIPKPADDL